MPHAFIVQADPVRRLDAEYGILLCYVTLSLNFHNRNIIRQAMKGWVQVSRPPTGKDFGSSL